MRWRQLNSMRIKLMKPLVKFDANKINEALLVSTVTSVSQTLSFSVEDFKMIVDNAKE